MEGFRDFENLLNGGSKLSGGGLRWGQNIKEKRRK